MILRRWLLVFSCLLMLAGSSHAGTITRGAKAGGGTDFNSGQTITASEFNTDFNNLYTLVNGQLDTDNIDTDGVGALQIAADAVGASELADDSVASANIIDGTIVDADLGAVTGAAIDDYSATEPEAAISTDPGTTGSESLATTMEGELERLRYAIARLAVGTTADATTWAWFDGPMRGANVINDGSFDVTDGTGLAAATSIRLPWATSGLVDISYTDPTDVSEGEGIALKTTANGGALAGVRQSLTKVKASTSYLGIVRVKATAGDTCTLRSTGGVATVTDVSATTGSYETLVVLFTTDATPTTVNFDLLSTADGDICEWDHAGVYEINDDPIPGPSTIMMIDSDTANSEIPNGSGSKAAVPNLSISFTPPGPGWTVWVDATIAIGETTSGGSDDGYVVCNIDNGGDVTGSNGYIGIDSNNQFVTAVNLSVVQTNLAPGTTLVYTVECFEGGAGMATEYNPAPDALTTTSSLKLIAIPAR